MKRLAALLCVLGLGLMAGCTGAPRDLSLSEEGPARPRTSSKPAPKDGAPVRLLACEDERPEGSPDGQIGFRMVNADEAPRTLEEWLRGELAARHPIAGEDADAVITLRPVLRKLYIESLSSSKSAVIVVKIHYTKAGHPGLVETYRGQATSMNWTGSDDELRAAFRKAFKTCWAEIERDIALFAKAE
jgi:hypothetical protein